MKDVKNIQIPPTYDQETARFLKALRDAIIELQDEIEKLKINLAALSRRG